MSLGFELDKFALWVVVFTQAADPLPGDAGLATLVTPTGDPLILSGTPPIGSFISQAPGADSNFFITKRITRTISEDLPSVPVSVPPLPPGTLLGDPPPGAPITVPCAPELYRGYVFECVRFTAQFGLNAIPSAAASLAIGREVATLRASAIHRAVNNMKLKLRVNVFLQAKSDAFFDNFLGDGSQAGNWPDRTIRIFDGYTSGSGYERSTGETEFTLNMEHWLADLNFSSAICRALCPQNPRAFSFSAPVNIFESLPALPATGHFTGMTVMSQFVTIRSLLEDFWGKGLLPAFAAMSGGSAIVQTDIIPPGIVAPGRNDEALKALCRFVPSAKVKCPVPPLQISVDGPAAGDMNIIAFNIANEVSKTTLTAYDGYTLWDKLVGELSPSFMFAVVPLVETALVVPYVAGLRTPYLTLFGDEYDFTKLTGDMPRILQGVGVFGAWAWTTQAAAPANTPNQPDYKAFGIGGFYVAADTGQIMLKRAPGWSAGCVADRRSVQTAGVGFIRGTALNPGVGVQPFLTDLPPGFVGPPPPLPDPAVTLNNNAKFMTNYARALYVNEILAYRRGAVAGKLRFDVCPGTVVALEVPPERFMGLTDQLGQFWYGTVQQVSYYLDAQNAKAGTSFELAHLRTGIENASDRTSIDFHPLWNQTWNGCNLIEW